MHIEFRLSHNDHRIVEDFLATARTQVLSAIHVEAPYLERQREAADAARKTGIAVVVETLVDRLAYPGYTIEGIDYGQTGAIDRRELKTDSLANEFVKRVVAHQDGYATEYSAPSFFCLTPADLELNLDLARRTRALVGQGKILRSPLIIGRALLEELGPAAVGARYHDRGVDALDLRLTPFGGHDDGVAKLRSGFMCATLLRDAGLRVLLGLQGNVGPVALTLGAADAFSVGIGQREQLNYRQLISNQQRTGQSEQEGARYTVAGIRLPALDITVRRTVGTALLRDTQIRSRLGINAEAIHDPAKDPRPFYIQDRIVHLERLADQPSARWRQVTEADRLTRAIELRQIVNEHHLPEGAHPLKLRTLQSLKHLLAEALAD